MPFLSSVRGRSRSLLLSASLALGAGCGLGTAGWVWLDAAPASAQPLVAIAPLSNPHTAASSHSASANPGHKNGAKAVNGNGDTNGNGNSQGKGNGNGHGNGKAHTKGHSAQAPGHEKAPAPQTLNPQVAVPRKARTASPPSTPAAGAPPIETPAPIRALSSIAIRVGSTALDLTGAPSGGLRSALGGPVLQALVPEGWLPGASFYRRELGLLNGSFSGPPLQVARRLKLPIALLVGGALFLLIQALVDRRDPKVSLAPEHAQDDSLDFV